MACAPPLGRFTGPFLQKGSDPVMGAQQHCRDHGTAGAQELHMLMGGLSLPLGGLQPPPQPSLMLQISSDRWSECSSAFCRKTKVCSDWQIFYWQFAIFSIMQEGLPEASTDMEPLGACSAVIAAVPSCTLSPSPLQYLLSSQHLCRTLGTAVFEA